MADTTPKQVIEILKNWLDFPFVGNMTIKKNKTGIQVLISDKKGYFTADAGVKRKVVEEARALLYSDGTGRLKIEKTREGLRWQLL